jgi:pimeloyl-ACP methyl ester carboxylesterase
VGRGRPETIDIGGRRLAYANAGRGAPTVVFENGLGTTMASWETVAGEVAGFARVVLYDRAGIGGSDPAPRPRTCQQLVDDLAALLGAVDVPTPYVLVGHSYGGPIVRLFASQHGDAVGGLVLVDAAHEDQYDKFLEMASDEEREGVRERYRGANSERIDQLASAAQQRAGAPLRPMPLVVLTRTLWPQPSPQQGGSYMGVPREEMDAAWGTLQESLAGLVPGARHVTAEYSGHFIQRDDPTLVVGAIREVVEAVRGGVSRLA